MLEHTVGCQIKLCSTPADCSDIVGCGAGLAGAACGRPRMPARPPTAALPRSGPPKTSLSLQTLIGRRAGAPWRCLWLRGATKIL